MTAEAQARWGDMLTRGNLRRMAVLCGGVGLHAINLYIVGTVLPSVVADIGGLAFYAWSTTLFVVASIVGAAVVPTLGGRWGMRRAYRFAALLFCAGSILVAAAPHIAVLLAGRTVQGLGGGMLLSLCYAAVRRLFPSELWSRALAVVSCVWGAAALVGPFIGGIFAEIGWWRGSFWSVAAAALCFLPFAQRVLPAETGGGERIQPPWGRLALLAAAAVVLSAGGLMQQPALSVVALAVAAAAMMLLLRLDARPGGARLLPTRPFDPRTPLGCVYLIMALMMVGNSSLLFIPYVLQLTMGLGPLAAGYLAMIQSQGWTGATVATSSVSERGKRAIILLGPATQAAGLVGLAWVLRAEGLAPWAAVTGAAVALGLVGIGVGLGWAHLGTLVMMTAPTEEKALAASSVATNQMIATTFGSALGGFVANLLAFARIEQPEELAEASQWLFLGFAAAPALAVPIAVRLIRLVGQPAR